MSKGKTKVVTIDYVTGIGFDFQPITTRHYLTYEKDKFTKARNHYLR